MSQHIDTEWTERESPVDDPLSAVVRTTNGSCAVGENGRVLYRDQREWVSVVDAGPAAANNGLTCAAVTDAGKRVWFAGESGALGAYDVPEGRKHDHTAPKGETSTWTAIAVAGKRENESVRVANGSGEILDGSTDGDGCLEWGQLRKPGSGSSIVASTADTDGHWYVVDTNSNAFLSTGDGWETIGVSNAQGTFTDVTAGAGSVLIAGTEGTIYRYDATCGTWTPNDAGESPLRGCDVTTESRVAVGDGGVIYHRTPRRGWRATKAPVSEDLRSVALGSTDVAVGANGTIVERSTGG